MKWDTLFNRIRKQPAGKMQNEDVVVILSYQEITELLREKKPTYMIPLAVKYGTGRMRMWLVKKPDNQRKENCHVQVQGKGQGKR